MRALRALTSVVVLALAALGLAIIVVPVINFALVAIFGERWVRFVGGGAN